MYDFGRFDGFVQITLYAQNDVKMKYLKVNPKVISFCFFKTNLFLHFDKYRTEWQYSTGKDDYKWFSKPFFLWYRPWHNVCSTWMVCFATDISSEYRSCSSQW